MIKKLNESESLKFKRISPEEKEQKGILGRLYGPVASCVVPTRNGRKYSEQLWEKVFQNDIVQELFANGGLAGELQHPVEREETDPEKIAIIMPEPPVKDKDGHLVGYVDIVDTPCGRIAYQLAKYGFNFGISSRGTGDLISGVDGEEVDPDTYQLNAFDLVAVPALKDARLSFTESLDTKKYNKTLKQALTEELDKASDKDKEIMEEALDNLEISLNEKMTSEGINDVEEAFDPNGYTNAIRAISDGIEDDTDIEALQDYLQNIIGYCRSIADDYDILLESVGTSDCSDKEDQVTEGLPIKQDKQREFIGMLSRLNSMADLILNYDQKYDFNDETDKVTIDHINDTVDKIQALASKLARFNVYESVSNNGCSNIEAQVINEDAVNDRGDLVKELQEALMKSKELEKDNLSLQEKLSVCNAKEKSLQEQLKKYKTSTASLSDVAKDVKDLKEQLEQKDKVIKSSGTRIKNLLENKKEAKVKLSEALSNVENLEKKVESLNKSLNESISSNKELTAKNDELVKKYRKVLHESKERYITAKAVAYGISENEVKSNLNESYSFKDIDSICEELSERKKNMSKLPFRITEDTRISLKTKKDPILRGIENDDDDVSDTLLTFLR